MLRVSHALTRSILELKLVMRTRPLCTRANWMMLPFPFFHICWSCHNTARHRKCAYGSWLYESTTSYCIESIPLHHRSAIYIWLLRACTTHTSPNRPSPLHSPRRTDIAGCRPYECVAPFAHEYPQYSFINNNSEYAMVTCAAHRTFFFFFFSHHSDIYIANGRILSWFPMSY